MILLIFWKFYDFLVFCISFFISHLFLKRTFKAYDGLVDYAAKAHYKAKHSKNKF
ncbi:hypothetical protein CAMRE0001_1533 [Campylobacter rectus RM3267]|uniref:Uncharacterized protein n=1 Tax=Campylobacter rectus RM3267 TaxID=553218 RepID=B9CZH4_CAMRE|nr:hypothetical protein CAMRE0001_1533 [Campylobacter rectus RM3267]